MTASKEPVQADAAPERVALDDFCQRLSQTDRRVELISGFHYAELAAGRQWDVDSAFAVRFTQFISKPA